MTNFIDVYYIFHSGFAVNCDERLYIFDFYSDKNREGHRSRNTSFVADLINRLAVREVYFFVSHGHGDHFDPDIFAFNNLGSSEIKVRYVFSSDVSIEKVLDNYYFIEPYKALDFGGMKVEAFGSTDAGVSFLIKSENNSIFHAGDLNWWYWFYESTPEELAEYEEAFKYEIAKITDKGYQRFDAAFFPVDPRLKDYSSHGANYFLEHLKPKYFFPMHFFDDFQSLKDFKNRYASRFPETEIMKIEQELQEFQLQQ